MKKDDIKGYTTTMFAKIILGQDTKLRHRLPKKQTGVSPSVRLVPPVLDHIQRPATFLFSRATLIEKWITILILGTFAMTLKSEDVQSAIRKDLTFEVIYTSSQTNVDATSSKGDPKGQIQQNKGIRFDFEPMATVNNGLMIGKDCASVSYDTAQNLTPLQGTLETVIKNMNWQWDDGKVHLFLSSLGPNLVMYVYKHAEDGLGIYLEHPSLRKKTFPRIRPKNWGPESKHHLVVTWDNDEIILYLDGVKQASGNLPPITAFPRKITVGSSGEFGSNDNTAIGLLRFYRRSLKEVEIAALAMKELPSLQIDIADKDKLPTKVLAESPWFKDRPRIGLEALSPDYVPAPWTPVIFKNMQGKVWGRIYDLSGDSVLSGIVASQIKLLQRPVRLEVNGEAMHFDAPTLISQAPGRVIWERKSPQATLTYKLEYDGMIWCKLSLNQKAKPVEKLIMIIPMTSETAQSVHYTGVVNTLRSVVAPEFSYTHTLAEGTGEIFKREFCTHLWIGSTRAGLQFFIESDQNWYPKERNNAFQICRNATDVEVKINFVMSKLPANTSDNLDYHFGFIATPVKPMPQGWRAHTISAQFDAISGDKRGSLLIYWPDDWIQMMLDPEPHRGINKEKVHAKLSQDVSENRQIIPYWSRLHLPLAQKELVNPDGYQIYKEWGPDPQRQRGGSRDWMRCSSTSSWSDYLVWCVDQWSKRFGHIDGVYIDEMELTPNSNAASGGGYVDLDGLRRPTYSAIADRDLYKRMHYIIKQQNDGRTPWSVAHCSGTHMMEILSPFTVFLTGEHLYSGYFSKDSELLPPPEDRLYYYSYSLPIDRVKTEFYWRQWGAVIAWLPCLKNQRDIMTNPIPTRDLLSRIMQADVLLWPLWCNADEVYKTTKFRNEFSIGEESVEFTPFWENNNIKVKNSQVVIGYYRNGDKILAIISNLNRHPVTLKPEFDAIKVRSIKNAETVQEIVDGEFTIPRNDYIALRINY